MNGVASPKRQIVDYQDFINVDVDYGSLRIRNIMNPLKTRSDRMLGEDDRSVCQNREGCKRVVFRGRKGPKNRSQPARWLLLLDRQLSCRTEWKKR